MTNFSRRRVLRGMLNGGAVGVALPLLDCFLNGNGNAFADGKPMPVRYGLYSWGLGMSKKIFVPTKTGKDFEFPEEIVSLAPLRQHLNILTNFNAFRDSAGLTGHFTGWVISRTGAPPVGTNSLARETWDIRIANDIGRTSRFKTLTATASGNPRTTYSYEDPLTPNPAEYSPIQFYQRLFGPDFNDPNAAEFKPSPRAMARKSALSAVMEQIKELNQRVGADDKARLDQYFTGLRHLEKQLDQQLTKPEPIASCIVPKTPKEEIGMGNDSELVTERNKLMSDMLAMAVACDQTRVINMAYTDMSANTIKPGFEKPHHTASHEEPVDEKLGYQPNCSWLIRRSMEGFAYFVEAFAKIKEGDGTLLDNMLIVADSDHGDARTHALDNMPMFTAGRAGGKLKTGMHLDMKGTPMARAALTALNLAGVKTETFGGGTNQTSDLITDIMV